MIIDHVSNAYRYRQLSRGLSRAVEFLARPDLSSLAPGRHEIEGDHVWALVSDYTTSPMSERRWEAHRRHMDVHSVVRGSECIGYSPVGRMRAEPYDEAKDILWLSGTGTCLTLLPGYFMVLWPDEAHMPGVAHGDAIDVRKVVVKILVDDVPVQP